VTTGVLAAACLTLILRSRREAITPNAPIARFVISSVGDSDARMESAAIAPDGQTIAVSARTRDGLAIWTRRLADPTPRRLQGSDGGASPFFSPDGRWIGFVGDDGFVRKLPVEGGAPTTLAKMPAPRGILWATPDTIVAGMAGFSRATMGLSRLSASGSDAGPLTTPEDGGMHHWPILSSDGQFVIYTSISSGADTIQPGIISLATGRSSTLPIPGVRSALPFGVRDGSVLYRDSLGAVWSVLVDFRSQRVAGPPVRLDASTRLNGVSDLRFAGNGALIYTRADDRLALIIGVDRSRPDTMDVSPGLLAPRWSPDGQAVSMLSIEYNDGGLVLIDRQSRTSTRLTTWRSDLPPVWSTDGTRVLTTRPETADTVAWWVWRDGGAEPARFASAASGWGLVECAPSPDQRFVAMDLKRGRARSIFVSPAGGRPSDAKLLIENAQSPRWSPDGNWIAYEAATGGTTQVFAQRYPAGGRVQLSEGPATHPVWARNGAAIYFESGRSIMRAELETTSGGLRVRRRAEV